MEEFLINNAMQICGWLFTACLTFGALLYKGVWKAHNLLREDHDTTRSNLDRLIGEHRVNHKLSSDWGGEDRRKGTQ